MPRLRPTPFTYPHVQSVVNQTYELLSVSAATALVTNGTATLETTLFGVPEIICYKGNPVSYRVAKMLVKHQIYRVGEPDHG